VAIHRRFWSAAIHRRFVWLAFAARQYIAAQCISSIFGEHCFLSFTLPFPGCLITHSNADALATSARHDGSFPTR
jgi:hypothetical protein